MVVAACRVGQGRRGRRPTNDIQWWACARWSHPTEQEKKTPGCVRTNSQHSRAIAWGQFYGSRFPMLLGSQLLSLFKPFPGLEVPRAEKKLLPAGDFRKLRPKSLSQQYLGNMLQ